MVIFEVMFKGRGVFQRKVIQRMWVWGGPVNRTHVRIQVDPQLMVTALRLHLLEADLCCPGRKGNIRGERG
jgi:hypothetical protein